MKIVLLLLINILLSLSICINSNEIMSWLCLERCGDNSTYIQYQLNQIQANVNRFKSISFEIYNLGPNSTLIQNNLTDVSNIINAMGLETYAMISSYPYPSNFIDYMREVFNNPTPFINDCIINAKEKKLTGYNIDWEPTNSDDITQEDSINYANFLNRFSNEMHKHDIKVSVDIGLWSPIWNLTAISNTNIDQIITMNTYTNNKNTWYDVSACFV